MMELSAESLTFALNHYALEVEKSHQGTQEDPLHTTRADGMRKILYDLELLTDQSNHVIVEAAIKKVENKKAKIIRRAESRADKGKRNVKS